MKRILLSGVAIAASFGLATTALAQYGSNHQYSSYGYASQEAAQEAAENAQQAAQAASPSDAPTPAAVQQSAPAASAVPAALSPSGYGCDTGYSAGGYSAGGYAAGGCASGNCGSGGGYGGGIGSGSLLHSGDRSIVVGLRALYFERDYEDDRGLGSNVAGAYLFSTDADHDWFGGFEATVSSRGCSGSGWEFGYWGLYPDQADTTFVGVPLFSDLNGLAPVDLAGVSAYDALNAATDWRLYRDTEINNLEFNLLKNGGQTCGLLGGTANIEWLAGLRWFGFNEDMRLAAGGVAAPFLMTYDNQAENSLFGFQLGARIERCISSNLTWNFGTKFGLYNNDIYTRQIIQDGAGNVATVPSGPVDYSFAARKKELSTLGELDFGLNYQFNSCTRANFGYRAVGVTSVALAADQIPYNANDTQEIQRIKSNGNLLLHGFYFGIERSF